MDREELKVELKRLGVRENEYNLYGSLEWDNIILYNSYNDWQVFYFDERGGRSNEKVFKSECEACWYIFKLFRDNKEIEEKFNLFR